MLSMPFHYFPREQSSRAQRRHDLPALQIEGVVVQGEREKEGFFSGFLFNSVIEGIYHRPAWKSLCWPAQELCWLCEQRIKLLQWIDFSREKCFATVLYLLMYLPLLSIKQSMKAQVKPIKKRHRPVTFASLGQSATKMQRMFGTVICSTPLF